MKMLVKFSPLFFLIILFSTNCNDNDSPVEPKDEQFIYPLEVGNKWTYAHELYWFNYRLDSADYDTLNDFYSYSSIDIAEIVRNEIISDSIETFVLRSTEIADDTTSFDYGYTENYINNREDGLYRYAYSNPGAAGFVVPKRSHNQQILFNGKYFNNTNEIIQFYKNTIMANYYVQSDTLRMHKPPILTIKYPLEEQESGWIYSPSESLFEVSKKYIGRETIILPLGEFNCYKLQWLYDFDNNGEWDDNIQFFDYITEKGLVKRTLLAKDLEILSSESPEPVGYFDEMDEYILTEINF